MKKIGLFYGTETAKTKRIADKIQKAFEGAEIDVIPVENAEGKNFKSYDNLIVGAATWFDGELPTFWDELIPDLDEVSLKGKKVAIFGLGDQKGYSENFADSIGLLAEAFESVGADIVGKTSTEGYTFEKSKSVRDGQFLGLAIDIENQHKKTDERITQWVEKLKKEFK